MPLTSVIIYSGHYRELCTLRDHRYFSGPQKIPRRMHRGLQPENDPGSPWPACLCTGVLVYCVLVDCVCKLNFIFLDEFSLPRRVSPGRAHSSWFLYKFPTLRLKLWASVKRHKGREGKSLGEGKRAEIKKSVELWLMWLVYAVFSHNLWRNSEFLWVCPIEDIWPTVKSLSYPHDQRLRKWKIFKV